MLDKLKNMFEAQKKINEIKKNLENTIIEHSVSDGKLKLSMDGTQQVISVDINPELLQPEKKDLLQKLFKDCVNGASEKVQKVASEKLKSAIGDLKIPGL